MIKKTKGKIMSEDKEYVADERMKLFFKNILDLKAFIKKKADETNDETLSHIYERLNTIMRDPINE